MREAAVSFGRIQTSSQPTKFGIEIDRTAGPDRTNKLQASIKNNKVVFSRTKESSAPGFLKKIADFFTKQKTDAAKEFVKSQVAPMLEKLGVSHSAASTLMEQAFSKKGAINADLFMNIMDANAEGIYFIPYGKNQAVVTITVKE